MKLANQILDIINETEVDREALNRYMSLPGIRKPYTPFSPKEWEDMAMRLTRKYYKTYDSTVISFSDFHFELERVQENEVQLPVVERMMTLALEDKNTLKKIRRINGKYSELQNRFGKNYDAYEPRRGSDYAKRGGMNVRSESMKVWLVGVITGEIPRWFNGNARQTWKILTCSDKKTFVPYRDDENSFVESNGTLTLSIEIE